MSCSLAFFLGECRFRWFRRLSGRGGQFLPPQSLLWLLRTCCSDLAACPAASKFFATVLVGAVAAGRFGFLRSRVSHFLGAISYPFYLTHPIGLFLAGPFVQSLPLSSPFARVFVLAVSSIALAIPLAWVLHVFVCEDPVLRARPRIRVRAPGTRQGVIRPQCPRCWN